MPVIAWGAKVPRDFKSRIIDMSVELGCDPSHLMAAMAFETGERFTSDVRNVASGATGLIQFMPSTAAGLGTTVDALKRMDAVAQLSYVRTYLLPYKGRMRSLSDVYMTILWPAAVGKPEAFALFRAGSKAYSQNKGLDADADGVITKAEAASRVAAALVRGMRPENRG